MSGKITKYEREVMKGMEPKTPKTQAKQIARLAQSNIQAQIYALEGSITKKEIAIENLKDKEKKAFYATSIEAVEDGDKYLENLIDAGKAVDKAEEEMEKAKELKTKLEGYLAKFEDTVESAE
jgi:hypothetical protein